MKTGTRQALAISKKTKIVGFLLCAMFFAPRAPAEAQRLAKIPRIGYLSPLSRAADAGRIGGLLQGLNDLGYAEGKNIIIEYRFSEGKAARIPALAAELVRLNVDVIVTAGSIPARAAQQATKTIPIVMAYMTDPVALGFVDSLAKPGRNITGLTQLTPELSGKRLELLKEVVPQASRIAILGEPHLEPYEPQMKELDVAGRALGLQLQRVELRGAADLEGVFSTMIRERPGGLLTLTGQTVSILRKQVVALATKNRLPAMYPFVEFVDSGGLMSYGPNYADMFRRAAIYVDKILKGTNPGEIPVEQPTKFELIVNLKTAKQIDLTIPPNVLARADRVIK